MSTVTLGSGRIAAADIVLLASGRARTEVPPDVLERLAEARRALDRAAASGLRIYGMNTGLGAKVGMDLTDDPAAFQNLLVRGRAVGSTLGGWASMQANTSVAVVSRRVRRRRRDLNSGSSGLLPAMADGGARKISTDTMGFTTGWVPVL